MVTYTLTQSMALLYTITHPSRIHDVKFFRQTSVDGHPEVLLVAAEDKKVTVYELFSIADTPPRIIAELVGHTNRQVAVVLRQNAHASYTALQSESYRYHFHSYSTVLGFKICHIRFNRLVRRFHSCI